LEAENADFQEQLATVNNGGQHLEERELIEQVI
jgi:hypothetical protein